MAYTQQDYAMGAEYGYETPEERRRREEEEARQREIEMMANAGMGLPQGTPAGAGPNRGLADLAGAYMNRRMDQAGQRVADAGQVFENPQAVVETQPTPVKQTITTDPQTGEQKMKIEGSVQDLTAANPLTPTVSGPAVPAMMPPPAAPQAQAQAQPRPMPTPVPVPAQLPAAGPINPAAAMPEIGQVPTPGPGVQVAGAPGAPMPAVPVAPVTMAAAPAGGQTPAAVASAPGASVAQIAQQAPAVTAPTAPAAPVEPAWVAAANAAGTDFGKLVDVAAKFPESRGAIQLKLQGVVEENRKAAEAQRIVEAAQSGDPKAMNKLEQALRPTRGKEREEVTTSDYLKAYMYARLGLNDLSAEVQAKIAGRDTKFGQVQLGNTTWSIETNAKTGEIVRAKDDEGNIATQNTINKLSASGQKTGTQSYSQTGEIHNTSDGKQVVKVFNSTTGKTQWTDVATGDKWSGTGTPRPQSISSQAAKMDYGVISDYRKKFGTDIMAAADQARKDGVIKTPEDYAAFTEKWKLPAGVPGYGGPGTTMAPAPAVQAAPQAAPPQAQMGAAAPAAPAAPARPVPTAAPAAQAAPAAAPAVSGARTPPPVQGARTEGRAGGNAPVRGTDEAENVYKNRVEDWKKRRDTELDVEKARREAEQRVLGETAGKAGAKEITGSANAREVYDMVRPINDALKRATGSGVGAKVDDVAAFFGISTDGAKATAELQVLGDRILKSVPRFEGPQSDRDVEAYKAAAGKLSDPATPNATRAAAFKTIVDLNQKYFPALDWTFSSKPAESGGGTTSSGNKYKRVQ
jgi:hypothetical protein